MADNQSSGEKTEEPTQKKIDDARKKGQVWKSKDLSGVAVFLAGLGTLKATWDWTESQFRQLFTYAFDKASQTSVLDESIRGSMMHGLTRTVIITAPVLV